MSDERWADDLRRALSALGVSDVESQRLTVDSVAEARDADRAPAALYGPAALYARTLVSALRAAADGDRVAVRHEPGPVLLRLTGVGRRYGRREVLRDVHLTLCAGEVAAVVGANGAGKSTLLKICAGLLRATTGSVQRCRRIGYVPQDGGVVGMLTPAEHFELVGAAAGMDARRARSTGEHLASRLSWRPDPGVPVERLSGGTRQKLNLVLGELAAPDLLLLDEPYQGFDQGSYVDFWDQVLTWRDAGKAVLVVTHLLHELDRVDHVVDLGVGAAR